MSDIKPTFAGEMQLAGWSETHTGGCKVTFWLESSEDLDAFRALTVRKGNTAGHRFMAALVEIGDDELPVQEPAKTEKPKGGELAKLAGILCRETNFAPFIRPIYDKAMGGDGRGWGDVTPQNDFGGSWEKYARHAICVLCEVDSRSKLDHDATAAAVFHEVIRKPYQAWQAASNRTTDKATA